MPTKGSFAGSKFKKRIFFELFWGKSWSKEPPVAEKGLWLLKKKKFLLVSQFKKLSFKSSPVKKFESQGQKTPKFWTSAVVHYHLLKAWKSQLWATRAFFFNSNCVSSRPQTHLPILNACKCQLWSTRVFFCIFDFTFILNFDF